MSSKSSRQPSNSPLTRTYRAEGATALAPLRRGYGVIQGTADDQVKVPTGAGQRPVGVVMETQTVANGPVSIAVFGDVISVSGQATLTPNMELMMDTNGKFVTAEADTANERSGRAVNGADADGDEFLQFFNSVLVRT
jgi:hypothetical protein